MKRMFAALLSLALLAALLSGCAGREPVSSGKAGGFSIVATSFPAYDLARAVCGQEAEITLLLPPGAESHSYEPTPRDILAGEDCGLFLYLGGESDAWVETILSSLDAPAETLRMIDCVETLEEETLEGMTAQGHSHDDHEDHDDHDAHDDHDDNDDHDDHDDHDAHDGHGLGEVHEIDEHVWTAPENAGRIARAIAQRAAELDPGNAEVYLAAADAYQREIDALDRDFRAFFDTTGEKTLVFGDRFPLRYFAEAYGLTCYAAFPGCSTQTEPSAATVAFLTEKVREEGISTVFYIEFSNHLVADSIAEAAGAETALFHSCHNVSRQDLEAGATYLSLMRGNLETLKRCML